MNKQVSQGVELEEHWEALVRANKERPMSAIAAALRRVERRTGRISFGAELSSELRSLNLTEVEADLLWAIDDAVTHLLEVGPSLKGSPDALDTYREAAITIFANMRQVLQPYERDARARRSVDIDTSDNDRTETASAVAS